MAVHSGSTGVLSLWNRDSVCVEQTQCLCGTHTVSLCGTHTVQVGGAGGAGGFASNSNPTLGLPSPPTHTPKIAIPQLRGEKRESGPQEKSEEQGCGGITKEERTEERNKQRKDKRKKQRNNHAYRPRTRSYRFLRWRSTKISIGNLSTEEFHNLRLT